MAAPLPSAAATRLALPLIRGAVLLLALVLTLALSAAGTALAQAGSANAVEGAGAPRPTPFSADAAGMGAGTAQTGEIAAGDRSQASPSLPDGVEWERVAERAESVIEAGRASTETLERLRTDLAGWRNRFREAQSANATRIDTVKAQIAALGPPPAADQTEAPEIALRRRQLDDTLAQLDAPRVAAEEAWSRADALIRSIDSLIRERNASELLRLGPSPVNPALWPAAWRELRTSLASLGRESAAALSDEGRRAATRDRLPAILGLLLFAVLALHQLPRWLRAGARRLAEGRSGQAAQVLRTLASLLRLALAAAAVLALRQAVLLADLTGYRGAIMTEALASLALVLLGAGWLAARSFPASDRAGTEAGSAPLADPAPLLPEMAPERQTEARILAVLLAAMLCGVALVRQFAQIEGWSEASRAVWQFPMLALAGLALARLGHILTRVPGPDAGAAGGAPPAPAGSGPGGGGAGGDLRRAGLRLLGRGLVFLGIGGVALAAIGYQAAALYLIQPPALTLALLAALVQVQELATRLYGLASGREGAALDAALWPVLMAILLGLAALPVLALIWGARVADLSEMWGRARTGLPLGDIHISPGMLVTMLVTFTAGYALTRIFQGTLRVAVLPKTRLDPGAQSAVVAGVGYLGVGLAALLAITTTGLSLTSLAVVFGALSVGIGFGLQNIVQNFVAGIILLVERPVAVGDWIEVGGNMGIVQQISVRATKIEAFDRTLVVVPNGDFISGTVRNWTRGNLLGRVSVELGVAHGSDTRQVERLLREIAEAHPQVMLDPAPAVVFDTLGPDALGFTLRVVIPNVNFLVSVGSELRHEIVRRLTEAGIELARPRRDLRLERPGRIEEE